MDEREAAQHLPVFQRPRWAVQASYFAGRLAGHDLTGSSTRRTTARACAMPVTP